MGKALLGLALIVALILTFTSFDPTERSRRDSAAFYQAQQNQIALERDRLALDAQRTEQARAEQRATLLSPVWVFVGGGLLLLVLVGAGMAVIVSVDAYKQRRTPLIYPTADGLYPLARPALVDGTYDQLVTQVTILAQEVRAIAAAHQHPAPPTVPMTLTYAPHFPRNDVPQLVAPALVEAEPGEGGSFADLLDAGRVGRGNPLHLGFSVETGKALAGSWLDLYSTAVAGMSGTGKTTSQRFLAAQTALHGARFAVVDPHAGAAEDSLAATLDPLSGIYLCEPASADKAILEVVRLVADIGQRRVAGKDGDRTPIILWLDELTSLLGRSTVAEALGELLERIAQEYRKAGVYCCASGQIWTASRATSELRDSFASVLCHRMKRGQARLLLPTEEAETVERLPIGQAVLWRTSGESEQVIIPNTTAADLRRVGGLLAGPTTGPQVSARLANGPVVDAPWPGDGPVVDATADATNTAAGRAIPQDARVARVLGLFAQGKNVHEVVAEIYGTANPGSRQYKSGREEVEATIRQALAGQRQA